MSVSKTETLTDDQHYCQRTYTVVGVEDKSSINIKDMGVFKIKKGQSISDTQIDRFPIMDGYTGHIFVCNISKAFVFSNKVLPVLYVAVWYAEEKLVMSKLFDIWLKFHIDVDKITSYEQLITDNLSGHFSIELVMDDEKCVLEESIKVYPGNDKILDKLKTMIKSDDMQELMKDMVLTIKDKSNTEKQKARSNDFKFDIIKPTLSEKDYQ